MRNVDRTTIYSSKARLIEEIGSDQLLEEVFEWLSDDLALEVLKDIERDLRIAEEFEF